MHLSIYYPQNKGWFC